MEKTIQICDCCFKLFEQKLYHKVCFYNRRDDVVAGEIRICPSCYKDMYDWYSDKQLKAHDRFSSIVKELEKQMEKENENES